MPPPDVASAVSEAVAEAVGEAVVEVPRPRTPRVPTLREQRASTVARVLEEFERSGTLPSTLRRQIVEEESALRWSEGRPLSREKIEKHIDEWAAGLLEKFDRRESA